MYLLLYKVKNWMNRFSLKIDLTNQKWLQLDSWFTCFYLNENMASCCIKNLGYIWHVVNCFLNSNIAFAWFAAKISQSGCVCVNLLFMAIQTILMSIMHKINVYFIVKICILYKKYITYTFIVIMDVYGVLWLIFHCRK